MKIIAVIPARYASTRFPGKLLAKETGQYVIEHVYQQVAQAKGVDRVLVATDDEKIGQACDEFGCDWVMTREDHQSGTDRIAEAISDVEADVIINVQGDEPEIEPENIETLVSIMRDDAKADMATLCARIESDDDISNPNVVKVVTNLNGHAMYFSRSVIPYQRDAGSEKPTYFKHLGIYAYRRDVLLQLSEMAMTELEKSEKLEQLRALENGLVIAVGQVEHAAVGIDTPEQYAAFVERVGKSSSKL